MAQKTTNTEKKTAVEKKTTPKSTPKRTTKSTTTKSTTTKSATTKSTTTKTTKPKATSQPKTKKSTGSKSEQGEKRFAVVRIRGTNNVRRDINDTIGMMNLRRINNLSFIDDRPAYKGMLQKSKDFITWGEITWGEPNVEIVSQLLKKWGRILGDKPLTDAFVSEHSKFKTIDEFAKNFVEMKAELTDIATLKPFFRLHPPKGGYKGKGIKYAYKATGALGYRGSTINDLIKQMSGL
ncbi:MAG: 50S ribosomal protein L30 [Candidatus Hodarchaeales archaeon]